MNKKSTMEELERLSVEEFKNSAKVPIQLVLDNVRSMLNVGAIFRTADAFRIQHIHLCGITGRPPHRDIQKSALGATDSVSWSHHESTIDLCRSLTNKGVKVLALEQTTDSIALERWRPDTNEPIALVVGNEVQGVDQAVIDICSETLEIEQFGTKHSLNLSVSTGIALHSIFRMMANSSEL